MPENIHIALDTMGADFSPRNEVLGALKTLKETDGRINITLVGKQEELEKEVRSHSGSIPSGLQFENATEVITMHDEPVAALRSKRNSSIVKGLELIKA